MIVLVAGESVEGAGLDRLIRLWNGRRSAMRVMVVAPALNSRLRHWLSDEDEARRSAGLRLAAYLRRLSAAGIEAEGRIGDADPLQAISDALQEFAAQEIVIASNPHARSHWLMRDLTARARRRFALRVGYADAGLTGSQSLGRHWDGVSNAPPRTRERPAPAGLA